MHSLVEICYSTYVALLVLSACVGLLGLVSPAVLARLVTYSNRAVLTGPQTRLDQRRIDIDQFAIAHGRMFGGCVLGGVTYLYLVSSWGPQAYTKSMFLVIVTIAMTMGLLALWHMRRQSHTIDICRAEAHTDPLTGLTNRRIFEAEVTRRLAQRQRQGTPVSLLIIDIDQFKSFNDNYGHLLGDAVLIRVADTLQATARQMDIVARLGGDEFVVLLPDCDLKHASQAAERIRAAIGDRPLEHEGDEYNVTVSIGACEAQTDDDPITLIRRCDSALYAAKEAGRNRCYRHGGPEPAVAEQA